MPRKKHKLGGGNIKDEPSYDPFPKSGLVKQHERFIRDNVYYFCKQNPGLNRQQVLYRAIEIAIAAEKAFKPDLGSFATYLIWRLRELKRLHNEADKGVPINYAKGELEQDQAEERGEDVELDFSGGGNGPRLTFDLQWCLANVFQTFIDESEIRTFKTYQSKSSKRTIQGQSGVCTNYSRPQEVPILESRYRVAAGVQLGGTDNAPAVQRRVSADLPEVIRQQPVGEILKGWLRAVFDHLIRRQREADDETQKRLVGDYSPTFLEAEQNAVDVRFPGAKRPPKYLPNHMPLASLDEPFGEDDYEGDGGRRTLHDVVGHGPMPGSPPLMGDTLDKQAGTLKCALQEVRASLRTSELPVADRMMDILEGRRSYSQADLAADMRRSPGYVSKLWHSVAGKVANKIGDRK